MCRFTQTKLFSLFCSLSKNSRENLFLVPFRELWPKIVFWVTHLVNFASRALQWEKIEQTDSLKYWFLPHNAFYNFILPLHIPTYIASSIEKSHVHTLNLELSKTQTLNLKLCNKQPLNLKRSNIQTWTLIFTYEQCRQIDLLNKPTWNL